MSEAGNYTGLLTNPTYTLIHIKFQPAFDGMTEQVLFKSAIIHDFKLQTETRAYMSMDIVNPISVETIGGQDFSGYKVWVYNGEVFVSGMLKEKLVSIASEDFWFSPGFSLFG
ncbi:hypothetical protein LZZ85_25260 [Terrimonas sp. NA20]|uniref:Uncharacterized protein n=1 Tax=Terrimonas ginsenosidimutans TaxID=2908004 RepID=A0ABS9KZI2_9BACT|nr:hypothetical protein [Terrimonas ginsenosidimutans]MCG2617634.1 hypothetical protein [Terrimonas ginsenosidimutans]